MTTRIRPATRDDASAVTGVQIEAWRAAYRGLLPRRVLDGLSPDRQSEEWSVALRDAGVSVLVADIDGLVCGFARHGPVRADRGDPAGATAELYDLYVLPGRFGSGLGGRLMRAVLDEMGRDGHRVAVLWVLRGNMRARRFYERGGWMADGAERASDTARGVPSVRYRIGVSDACSP